MKKGLRLLESPFSFPFLIGRQALMKKGLRPLAFERCLAWQDWETSPDEEGIKTFFHQDTEVSPHIGRQALMKKGLRLLESPFSFPFLIGRQALMKKGLRPLAFERCLAWQDWETSPDEEGIKTFFHQDTEVSPHIGRQALMKKGLRQVRSQLVAGDRVLGDKP